MPAGWRGAWRLKFSAGAQAQVREHPIYPFSIVAGGVHSRAELENALKTDPVVAAHYADFNPAKFHVIKLNHAEYAYVSFRVGDNVYWTSHRVELRQGEALITDGENVGRARCGNRVSQTRRLPTYAHEPASSALNTPVRPRIETEAFTAGRPALSAFNHPGARSLQLADMTAPHGDGAVTVGGSPGGFNPMAAFAALPVTGCANGQKDVNGRCETPHTPPPTAPTPESATWVLLLAGGGMLAGAREVRRRLAA
ncbi:MAG: hypothetical protein ACRD3D_07960 [Terriglobia bacterium]